MRKGLYLVAVAMLVAVLALGCAHGQTVKRVTTDKQTDLSGHWNDTDSQQVAGAIVDKALTSPWLDAWKGDHDGKRPVVIVGTILNKSNEHISVGTFVKDIQASLINSGKVRFVGSASERKEVREERADMQGGNTADESRAALGNETGADFMLKGTLETIVDEAGASRAVWYQVNLELHDMTTGEIVWLGQHKIKKLIKNASVRW